jgi:hypothetical protein
VLASRKLAKREAEALLADVSVVIASKGKKVERFEVPKSKSKALAAMLGPTGNLRAPCLRAGKTLLVGFSEESFRDALG